MYSKNNKYMQEQKSANRAQRFSLRKLSIGTVSVLLGTLMFFSNGQVSADTTTGTDTSADAASVNSAANDTSASTVTLSSANSAATSDANSSAATSSAAANPQPQRQLQTAHRLHLLLPVLQRQLLLLVTMHYQARVKL